jgi:serine/threonine protein phosphatase PrpC
VSASATTPCPRCQVDARTDDRFCEACGQPLVPVAGGDAPTAPRREIDLGAAAGVTNPGLIKRENQDAFYLHAVGPAVVAVVCDGVSTSASAATAARLACTAAGEVLTADGEGGAHPAAMEAAVAAAQEAVAGLRWSPSPRVAAPACTIAAAVWDGRRLAATSIGDSRAYWLSSDAVVALTTDDSWLREQVDAGRMTPEEAHADGRAHQITGWLGVDAPEPAPVTRLLTPETPGWLIVCSDGLWNYAPGDEQLASWVREAGASRRPVEVARALVERALASGGHDNITVTLISVAPT